MDSVNNFRNRLFNSTGRKLRLFTVDESTGEAFALGSAALTMTPPEIRSRQQPTAEDASLPAAPAHEAEPAPPAPQHPRTGGDACNALRALIAEPVPGLAIEAAERLGMTEEKLAIIGGVPVGKLQQLKAGVADDATWAAVLRNAQLWLTMLNHG